MSTVITFQGFSQYQNFNTMAVELTDAYRAAGYGVCIIDARHEGYHQTTQTLLASGSIHAVFTLTGFGMDLNPANNIFCQTTTPVVSLYFDPLHLYLEQLRSPITNRLVTTSCDTDAGYWRTQPSIPTEIRFLPHAAAPQPYGDWTTRTIPLLLAASGVEDPETIRASWEEFEPEVREQLNRIIEVYRADHRLRPLTTIIAETIGTETDVVSPWRMRTYYIRIDSYLRAYYRWNLILALADQPLLVIGDNWDRLGERLRTRGRSRVRFRRALGTPEIYRLLGRTQIALNDCTPHHGSHERVMRATATGCLALTNRTAWFADAAPEREIEAVDLERDDVAGVVEALLADPTATAARAETGNRWFRAHHTWTNRVTTLNAWITEFQAGG